MKLIIVGLIGLILLLLFIINRRQGIEYFMSTAGRWAILQYDDRPLGTNEQALIDINKLYAKKHNYDYVFLNSGYEQLPPYWIKVAAVRDLLASGKYVGVCWIDTDAVFVNHRQSIEGLFDNNSNNSNNSSPSFLYSPDPPLWSSKFNAGVWFVRNDTGGAAIMNDWFASWQLVAKDWSKDGNNVWTCKTPWAGPSYEQGAFVNTILTAPAFASATQSLPYQYLQSIDAKNPNAFTLHFAGHQKTQIPTFLNDINRTHSLLESDSAHVRP